MIIPKPTRAFLKQSYRNVIFWKAIMQFQKNPEESIADTALISRLIYGWGNEGYSALEEYLLGCLQHVSECSGPILECGSGLSTILVGIVAQKKRATVWSLEHDSEWGKRVSKYLKKYRIDSVKLSVLPLKEYENFAWYAPPIDEMPKTFSLVLCDGPPGKTRGGRYGLLPIMKKRFHAGCIILLDDAAREEEQAIAARWANEFHSSVERFGSQKPYFRIILPEN